MCVLTCYDVCHVMSCHVMSYHVIHIMSCDVMFHHVTCTVVQSTPSNSVRMVNCWHPDRWIRCADMCHDVHVHMYVCVYVCSHAHVSVTRVARCRTMEHNVMTSCVVHVSSLAHDSTYITQRVTRRTRIYMYVRIHLISHLVCPRMGSRIGQTRCASA